MRSGGRGARGRPVLWKGSEDEHVGEATKIDVEWTMEMEKVGKREERVRADGEGDLLSVVRGE